MKGEMKHPQEVSDEQLATADGGARNKAERILNKDMKQASPIRIDKNGLQVGNITLPNHDPLSSSNLTEIPGGESLGLG